MIIDEFVLVHATNATRKMYEEKPEMVDKILQDGIEKAKKIAAANMKRIKEAIKINYFE